MTPERNRPWLSTISSKRCARMVRRLAAISPSVAGAYSDLRQRRQATGITAPTAGCRATSGAKASSTSQVKRAPGRSLRASVSAGMWWITSPSEDVLMKRISAIVPLPGSYTEH